MLAESWGEGVVSFFDVYEIWQYHAFGTCMESVGEGKWVTAMVES